MNESFIKTNVSNWIINKIETAFFSVERQFHVLKHLTFIDNKSREIFIANGYMDDEIKEKLRMISSKVHTGLCSNPQYFKTMVLKDISSASYEINKYTGNIEISIIFSKKTFPFGIGIDRLISIKGLCLNSSFNKDIETFKDVFVKIIGQITWTLIFIIKEEKNLHKIITVFPGTNAPPFPDERIQSTKLYNLCKEFWDNHLVF